MKFSTAIVSLLPAVALAGVDEIEEMLKQQAQNTTERGIIHVDNPILASLEAIWNYGCWCYFQENHGKGSGEAQNFMDKHCQILHHGYTCILMDAEDESDHTCDPFTNDYNTIQVLGNSADQLEVDCEAKNPGNNCAIRACAVESFFVLNIFAEFFGSNVFDPSLKHDLGIFDPSTCRGNGGTGGPGSPWACCGSYTELGSGFLGKF
jgi:hypothetical protein